MERWLPVRGYEGVYEVSDLGRVRSVNRVDTYGRRRRGKVLKPAGQYPMVVLSCGGETTTRTVHSMVLEAFVGPCPAGMEGCHEDGDPWNCVLSNLRWDTRKANAADMLRHGRAKTDGLPGEDNPNAYLTDGDIREIRHLRAGGLSPQRIADRIGTTRWNVRLILSRTNWRHVT